MQSLPERTTLQDLIMLDASQAAWLDQMSDRGVRNQTTLTLHKVATTSWGVQIQGLQSVLHSYLGHFGWTCAAPKVQPTVNSYSTIIDKLAKAFGLRSKELWSMMSMSSRTTLTSFANMAAVSRGRLVISMLQRIGSLAWLRPQKRIKMHSRCQLVWTCLAACVWLLVVILMLAQKSLHGSWHIFCVQLLLESLDAFYFHYCWPHIESFSIHNATQRIEQRLEWRQMPSATTCSSVPAASALTCLDLSYLMNRSFEAPKFMLLDHIFGGVYHPIYIQYTFNIHWDYHHFFF